MTGRAAKRSPVVVDPRRAELAKIDSEIERLAKQISEKRAAVDADQKLHPLDQSQELQDRLNAQIRVLRGHVDQKQKERFDVELGAEPKHKPATSAAAAPVQHRTWRIDEKVLKGGLPEYPDIVRGSDADKDDVFSDAFLAAKAFWEASIMDHFRKNGLHADQSVQLDFAASMQGEIVGNFRWLSARCMALEERLSKLEARPILEYRGVWKSTDTYKRGDLTTHDGSMWHAQVGSQGLMPGQGEGWRLCVKKGKDARP